MFPMGHPHCNRLNLSEAGALEGLILVLSLLTVSHSRKVVVAYW